MFIHIGGDYQILIRDIIGIFDFDAITENEDIYILDLLSELEEKMELETVSPDIPRSFILTLHGAYLSPINSITLEDRIKQAKQIYRNEDKYAR